MMGSSIRENPVFLSIRKYHKPIKNGAILQFLPSCKDSAKGEKRL